jgi:hypothetical protein
VAGRGVHGHNTSHCGTQSALGSIALDRSTHPSRRGVADAQLSSTGDIIDRFGRRNLKDQAWGCPLAPSGCNAQKVGPTPEMRDRHWHKAHAVRRLRPLARRRASTRRPPTVFMRERKPCRRARTILLG